MPGSRQILLALIAGNKYAELDIKVNYEGLLNMIRISILLFVLSGCSLVPTIGLHERVWCEYNKFTGQLECEDLPEEEYEVDCRLQPLDYSCEG